MTKLKTESDCGIGEFIHLASRNEPETIANPQTGRVTSVEMDISEFYDNSPSGMSRTYAKEQLSDASDTIAGTQHGDTVGFIDWPAALAVTWRKA